LPWRLAVHMIHTQRAPDKSGPVPCMRGMRRGYPFSPGDCIATRLFKASTPLRQTRGARIRSSRRFPLQRFLPEPGISSAANHCYRRLRTKVSHEYSMILLCNSSQNQRQQVRFRVNTPDTVCHPFVYAVWSHDPLSNTDPCARRMEDIEFHEHRRFAVLATLWRILVYAFRKPRALGIPRSCAL
jgi:hypothetical protein